MEISGRNALITGGAVRVGRAITLALARAGANVFVHYGRSEGPATETAAAARSLGVAAATGSADLQDPTSSGGLIQRASAEIGALSILVNNASRFPEDTLGDVTLEGFRRAQDLTLASPLFLTQAFAAALPESEQGAIVNITDVRTATPYKKHLSYILAKGGLDQLTRAAAVALAPRIRVNAVALGVVLPPPGEDLAFVEELARRLPLARPGGPEPVAAAVVALIENDFITGEIVRLDGGGHLV